MKKTLLSLACSMLLSASAFAQASNPFWVQQSFGPAIPANQFVNEMVVLNAATVWVITTEAIQNGLSRNYARTTDGGQTWTGGAIAGLPANMGVANITAIDANTAWIAVFPGQGGSVSAGGVYKTTNGGTSWAKQPSALFDQAASFANGVHFFDANNGVAWGDPTPAAPGGRFEIYTTADGGTNWTRVNNTPAALAADEYGLAGSYFALGNTIWLGGYSGSAQGARLLKSTDRGLTWTIAATDIVDQINYIAFTDAQRGLMSSGLDLVATNDGGTTNNLIATTGNFRSFGMDAVPGLANTYVCVGPSTSGSTTLADRGSSISRDGGRTWTDQQVGINLIEVDMFSPSIGYAGGITPSTGAVTGGMHKLNRVVTSNRASAALQAAVQVSPNPSNDGVFKLSMAANNANPRRLSVTDALGREVYTTTLRATGAAPQDVLIDLSKHKAGLYTLQLETEQGAVSKKLVIQ